MNLKKYKWLYLWVAAAALIVFGLVMIFAPEFGRSVVLYISAALLIAFVIIRFVPLIKTTKNKWAICINAIEMALEFLVGVLIVVAAIKGNISSYEGLYSYLFGGILYARGFVYLIETEYFGTKAEVGKFFLHIILLTLGTILIVRHDNLTEELRWIIAIVFLITGVVCVIDGGNNYNKYRTTYTTKKTTKKTTKTTTVLDKDVNSPKKEDNTTTTTYIA